MKYKILSVQFLSILFLLIASSNLRSQSQTTLKTIDSYLQEYKDKAPMPGFSVVIVEEDKVIYQKGYGVEVEGETKPMTVHTSTGVGDLTMSFTALAAMQLVEKGQLNLDEKVIKYLPWFRMANKDFSDEITMRMLLSHTSGIPAQFESIPNLDNDSALEEFVRSLSSYYLRRKPGLSYEYSREGFSVAGLVISEISGLSYVDYVEKNIFEPLKMNHTTTDPNRFEELQVLYGHEMGLEECIPARKEIFDGNYLPAGSEMRSSAEDLGHYLIALLNDGNYQGTQIISPKSIKEIWTPQTSFSGLGTMLGGNGVSVNYCLGWLEMNIDDRDVILHPGNTRTMASVTGLRPEKKMGIAILFNADSDRMNPYTYPSIQNIANNIIHLLNDEPPTDFATPRFDDPFDDDYDLPKDLNQKYVGQYISLGKAHPLFRNYNLEIAENENQELELKATQEGVLKGHFRLDFSNESRAALRGIVNPQEIQFKLFPSGAVGGIFMYGSEFKKKDGTLEKRFQLESSVETGLSFLFPKDWESNWNANQFLSKSAGNQNINLKASVSKIKSKNFEQFQSAQLNNQKVLTRGNLKKEVVNSGVWTEQSVFVKENEFSKQYLFILYQDPISEKQMELVLENPSNAFSFELQEMLMYLQKTVHF